MPLTAEAELVVSYSGLLAQSGATEVFLHCGEGPGEWRNVRDIPMEKGPEGRLDRPAYGRVEAHLRILFP